jgi:hypothetical protein
MLLRVPPVCSDLGYALLAPGLILVKTTASCVGTDLRFRAEVEQDSIHNLVALICSVGSLCQPYSAFIKDITAERPNPSLVFFELNYFHVRSSRRQELEFLAKRNHWRAPTFLIWRNIHRHKLCDVQHPQLYRR